MNWAAISFDWNQVRGFLATVEEGSLSAAARALGLTQPTLGRQVAALEEELGVLLFERVGRSLQLTPSGLELVEHVRAMGEAATRVSLAASGQSQAVEGLVRITAGDVFSAFLLPPILEKLRQIAPRIEVEIVADNDIRDLQHREADIAIRHVRPEQPELIARHLMDEETRFFAARSYIERAGRPASREDLSDHQFVSFGDIDQMIGFMTPIGVHLTRENFRVGSENGIVGWELTRRGFGIAIMSELVGRMTPEIEIVLPDFVPIIFPVWLTTHRELQTSRRIRVVFDLLADELKALRTTRRQIAGLLQV